MQLFTPVLSESTAAKSVPVTGRERMPIHRPDPEREPSMTEQHVDDEPDERDRGRHDDETFEQLADARRRRRLGDRVVDDMNRERNGEGH